MKTKINIKAGYSGRLLVKPTDLPDFQIPDQISTEGTFFVKTGQTVSAILE